MTAQSATMVTGPDAHEITQLLAPVKGALAPVNEGGTCVEGGLGDVVPYCSAVAA